VRTPDQSDAPDQPVAPDRPDAPDLLVPPDTERLRFRPMAPGDLDAMAALLGDPVVMRHYPRPKDRAGAEAWIAWNRRLYAERGHGLWVVELRATGEFVGDCGLTPQRVEGVTEIEVGYHVRADLQRRGYASEAAAACRDLARDALGVDRLIAIIHPDNVPSQRVAEKIGLSHERDVVFAGDRPARIYSVGFRSAGPVPAT